ncbi:MAG: hypothetical protein R2867_43610 [Caldilineaceae bacterium]
MIVVPLIGRLLMIDTLDMTFRTLKVKRNPECPVCGEHPTVTELIDYEQISGSPIQMVLSTKQSGNWALV